MPSWRTVDPSSRQELQLTGIGLSFRGSGLQLGGMRLQLCECGWRFRSLRRHHVAAERNGDGKADFTILFDRQIAFNGGDLLLQVLCQVAGVRFDGFHSIAWFAVESFDIDSKPAIVLTLLKDFEREALKALKASRAPATKGLTRVLLASFPAGAAYVYSLRDGHEVDAALEYRE